MTVGPNVGHAEVDVDLDTDHLVAQGEAAGRAAGQAYGDAFSRDANGRLHDAQGRFVSESRRSGRQSGSAFGDGFNRSVSRSFRRFNPFAGLGAQAERESGQMAVAITRLGPLILAALGVATLIGPAFAAALPALAGIAATVGVIALGWKDLQKAVKPLTQMFSDLRDPIGAILTDGIRPLAAELADNLFPVLKAGLGDVADATNGVITGFLNWLNQADTLGRIQTLLEGVAPIMSTLGQATIVFSDALLKVAVAALPAFKLLADFILGAVVAFDDWISGLRRTRELTDGITSSMEILIGLLQLFGGLIGQVFQLGQALGPAGLAALQGLANVLSIVIDLLIPVADALSENADSVRIFAEALGTLLLVAGGLSLLAGIITGAVGGLALLAAAFTVAFQSSAQFRDVVAQVGAFAQTQLIPALQAIATFITGTVVPALQQFAGFFQANILPPLQQFATFITGTVVPAIVQMAGFFASVGQSIATFVTAIQPVIEFLAGQFIPALVRLGEAFGVLFGAVVQLGQALGPVLKPALIAIAAIIIGGLLVAFAQIIVIITAVAVAVRIFAAGIRIAATVIGFLVGVVSQLIGVLGRVAGFIAGVFVGAIATARGLLSGLAGVIRTVIGVVSQLIGFVSNLIGRLAAIPGSIPQPFGAWDFITTVIGWVSDLIGFLADIPGSLPNPIDWALDGIVSAIETVADLLGSIPSSLPNPFSGWSIPDIPGGFDVPFVGAFGGIFDQPTSAIIGEAGKEVLVPLTKPNRALDLLERSGAADLLRNAGRAGGGETRVYGAETVHVHVPTDNPETVAEQFINRVSSRVVV